MIPPFTGGLHCGAGTMAGVPAPPLVIPPFTGGLHCGHLLGRRSYIAYLGDPAVHRRAPLRRLQLLGPAALAAG